VSAARWARIAGSAFLVLSLDPVAAAAETPVAVAMSLGAFDVFHGADAESLEVAGEVSFRPATVRVFGRPLRLFGWTLPPVSPVVGVMATEEGALYTWAGARLDRPLGRHLVLSSHLGIGFYDRAHDRDLGGLVELRSGLDLSYRLRSGRLGVGLVHLSNGRIYRLNPGSESLLITYTAAVR
jgi:hypothetical protein